MKRFAKQAILIPLFLALVLLLSAVASPAAAKSSVIMPRALQLCPEAANETARTWSAEPAPEGTDATLTSLDPRGAWQTITSMDFDGAWPNGWTLSGNYTYLGDLITWAPETYMWCNSAANGGWPEASTFDPNEAYLARPPAGYPTLQSWMIYGPFSLADATDAQVAFSLSYQLDSGDSIAWFASVDGSSFYGYGVTGGTSSCTSRVFDLKSVPTLGNLCGSSSVWIAFRAYVPAEGSLYVDGPFLDDIEISKYVGQQTPDLVVEELRVTPSSSRVGSLLTATVTVTNAGLGAAGPFQVDFYADRATAPGTGDAGDHVWAVTSLAAGASTELTWTFTPAGAGSYNAYAQADRLNAVDEGAGETNNVNGPFPYKAGGAGEVTYRAVICGISDYPGTANDLDYCDDDAIGMRSSLLSYAHWSSSNIQLLVDSAATKSAILAAINSMRAASDYNDVCLFFFSGHGTTGPDVLPLDETDGVDEYMVPYYDSLDLSSFIRDDELGDWLGSFPAPVQVILDTCFSGGQIKQFGLGTAAVRTFSMGYPGPSPGDGFAADLQPRVKKSGILTKDLDDTIGGVVLTACDDDEYSYETSELEHGVFTYYVLDALGSRVELADTDNDGRVSAEEVFLDADPRTRAYANQTPQLFDNYPAGYPNDEELTTVIYLGVPPPSDNISAVRGAPATGLTLRGIVTAKFADFMYVESADRSSGARVNSAPGDISVGDRVWFTGDTALVNGQKQISPASAIFPLSSENPLPYLGMRTRDTGGHEYGSFDPGVTNGRGALNVGLFVTVHGIVTYKDPGGDFFYIWDGGNRITAPVNDGNSAGAWGVRIAHSGVIDSTAVVPWTDWVEVEGIVSVNTTAVSGSTIPEILPSTDPVRLVAADFTTVNFPSGTILAGKNLVGIPHTPGNVGNGDSGGFDQGYDPVAVFSPVKAGDWYDDKASALDGRIIRYDAATGSSLGFDMWAEPHGQFGGIMLGDGYWVTAGSAWTTCSYNARVQNIPQWISGCIGKVLIANPQNHDVELDPVNLGPPQAWDTGVMMSDGAQVKSFYDASTHGAGWIQSVGTWWDNAAGSGRDTGVVEDWAYDTRLLAWHGYWFTWLQNYKSMIVP